MVGGRRADGGQARPRADRPAGIRLHCGIAREARAADLSLHHAAALRGEGGQVERRSPSVALRCTLGSRSRWDVRGDPPSGRAGESRRGRRWRDALRGAAGRSGSSPTVRLVAGQAIEGMLRTPDARGGIVTTLRYRARVVAVRAREDGGGWEVEARFEDLGFAAPGIA